MSLGPNRQGGELDICDVPFFALFALFFIVSRAAKSEV
jgi:hypothetical protein